MNLTLDPLHILVPTWFVGLSLIGLGRHLVNKRKQQAKLVRIQSGRSHK